METNVLVTGAAGYIGTMLIERLSDIPNVGRINVRLLFSTSALALGTKPPGGCDDP